MAFNTANSFKRCLISANTTLKYQRPKIVMPGSSINKYKDPVASDVNLGWKPLPKKITDVFQARTMAEALLAGEDTFKNNALFA